MPVSITYHVAGWGPQIRHKACISHTVFATSDSVAAFTTIDGAGASKELHLTGASVLMSPWEERRGASSSNNRFACAWACAWPVRARNEEKRRPNFIAQGVDHVAGLSYIHSCNQSLQHRGIYHESRDPMLQSERNLKPGLLAIT